MNRRGFLQRLIGACLIPLAGVKAIEQGLQPVYNKTMRTIVMGGHDERMVLNRAQDKAFRFHFGDGWMDAHTVLRRDKVG